MRRLGLGIVHGAVKHRLSSLFACAPLLLAIGCVVVDDDDEASSGMESAPGTGGVTTGDSGTSAGTSGDGSSSASSTEGTSTSTSGTTNDPSGSTGAESGSTGSGESGGDEGGGTIDVTLTGCDVDLGGTVVVSYNGSLGVASVYDNGASLTGSFQFDLQGTGAIALSTQHRVDTGEVINLVDTSTTWTNLDSDSLSGGVDRIGGTLTVNTWDPANGVSDIAFDGVSLLNVVTGNVCTIDGTIVTTELYP